MFAQNGEILAKIQMTPEIGNASLPLADHVCRCARQEPLGEALLPHSSAYGAQKLEQAAFAEEVQIAGVDMTGIIEPQPLLPSARPAILHARKTVAIKRRSPFGPG